MDQIGLTNDWPMNEWKYQWKNNVYILRKTSMFICLYKWRTTNNCSYCFILLLNIFSETFIIFLKQGLSGQHLQVNFSEQKLVSKSWWAKVGEQKLVSKSWWAKVGVQSRKKMPGNVSGKMSEFQLKIWIISVWHIRIPILDQ